MTCGNLLGSTSCHRVLGFFRNDKLLLGCALRRTFQTISFGIDRDCSVFLFERGHRQSLFGKEARKRLMIT